MSDARQPEMDALYSTVPEYQARNPSSFPTERSLEWFVKNNRSELLAAGALIEIAGRKRLHNERFTEIAGEIGRRVSAARRAPPRAIAESETD